MRNLVVLLGLVFSLTAYAQGPFGFCSDELETFPVLAQGREKPLFVLATDSIRFITGEKKVGELSATEAFCKLSLKAFGMPLNLPVSIRVDHVDVKKFLGIPDSEHSLPVEDLISKQDLIVGELRTLKENNAYKKELTKVDARLRTYEALITGKLWTVPLVIGQEVKFVTLPEYLSEERLSTARGSGNPVGSLMAQAKEDYLKAKGDHYLLELRYFKWNLFL